MADAYRRHDLLDVAPDSWDAALAVRPDVADVPRVAGWVAAGRPLILRRAHPGEASDLVPLGLPLPPGDGKRRIGFALPPDALRPRPPVRLAETRDTGPPDWRSTIDALVALGARHELSPRPFGGLLWQHLTGLPYLSAGSDLDLLWPVTGPVSKSLLDHLAAIEAAAPMRLDGEILLPGGGGVQWRELREAAPNATVLVKHRDRLALREAGAILAGEPE